MLRTTPQADLQRGVCTISCRESQSRDAAFVRFVRVNDRGTPVTPHTYSCRTTADVKLKNGTGA